ncbi:hypothetical protein RFI_36012, partial [Reticulomyxa filosa]
MSSTLDRNTASTLDRNAEKFRALCSKSKSKSRSRSRSRGRSRSNSNSNSNSNNNNNNNNNNNSSNSNSSNNNYSYNSITEKTTQQDKSSTPVPPPLLDRGNDEDDLNLAFEPIYGEKAIDKRNVF